MVCVPPGGSFEGQLMIWRFCAPLLHGSTWAAVEPISLGTWVSRMSRNPMPPGQKMKVLVAQSCLTLCDPMNCSPPGSSVHGILQAKTLEQVTIPFSKGSSLLRDRTRVSCTAGRFFTVWATREQKNKLWWIQLLRSRGSLLPQYSLYFCLDC